MNFSASEYFLGRQRCRQWVSLITQQLRLRHIYQIFALNLKSDKKASFYFTLHNSPMSSPFYTSEKICSKNPKWAELNNQDENTHMSSVVIRIWKLSKTTEDQIVLTWGVNFSGLVYLGNKITDLQPRYFKENTIIFFMQGGYFTSQQYIKNDQSKRVPFQKNLNLMRTGSSDLVLYRRVAVPVHKNEVQPSYSLEKLRRLQELQRQLNNKKTDVENIKQKIKKATESEQKSDPPDSTSNYNSNIRFAPQLLTMNTLNKMLHEKPTKSEREKMNKVSKNIEIARFRTRMLTQEKDRKTAILRGLKQKESKMSDENDDKNSALMSTYHMLNKDIEQLKEYKLNLIHHRELLVHINKQLHRRQKQLLGELLFIYPIEKIPGENKYTMLGIHLPDSDALTDSSNPGLSVVLGYICHILIMCSIFLQVPLRYPMRHFGSRSVIFDQVSAAIPDREREFPLYTKGKDKAHFGYAVYLLNKNLAQLRWYFYRKYTLDLKETLKHLLSFLKGIEPVRKQSIEDLSVSSSPSKPISVSSHAKRAADNLKGTSDSAISLDKLVSLSTTSTSSCSLSDPLLDSLLDNIRQDRRKVEPIRSPKKNRLKPSSSKDCKKEGCVKGTSEVLALPEAYLNKQISKDLFDRCASGKYTFSDSCGCSSLSSQSSKIQVKNGIEEFKPNTELNLIHSDSIEQGTDLLDPSTNLESVATKAININHKQAANYNLDVLREKRISRSLGSYTDDESSSFKPSLDLGSDPMINNTCDKSSVKENPEEAKSLQGEQKNFLENWLTDGANLELSSNLQFSEEILRISLQDISSPLTARTDRLLSNNQSFNLVRHRPLD